MTTLATAHRPIGTVLHAFTMEKARCINAVGEPVSDITPEEWKENRLVSAWMQYHGPETAPFEVYMRWGHYRVILSNINAADGKMGEGRMPTVVGALESLYPIVDVESVINPRLAKWLHRRGYRPLRHPKTGGNRGAGTTETMRWIKGQDTEVAFYDCTVKKA
jgi:hypothetical protein